MFDKYLYKTKDDAYVIQFFTKDNFIQDMNLYKMSGAIVYPYSIIYQSFFKDLGIPVFKTIMINEKNGKSNKNTEEVAINKTLKEEPYPFEKIKEHLLLEPLNSSEKTEFIDKVNTIANSRNRAVTKLEKTNPINSAYLLQSHCFLIEEKNKQLFLSRTEVKPNTIVIRKDAKSSNGMKTFLKHPMSMIDFLSKSINEKEYVLMSEIETTQLFGLYKNGDVLTIIPYEQNLEINKEYIKHFDIHTGIVLKDYVLENDFENKKNEIENNLKNK